MTVISEHVDNIAGADDGTVFVFASILLRDSDDGTSLITTTPTRVTPVAGVLTTPDLDPGPAYVRVGLSQSYRVDVPDSPTPIRLWPLIAVGLPVPPVEEATAVRNLGGIAGAKRVTLAEYQAMPTPDLATLFIVP